MATGRSITAAPTVEMVIRRTPPTSALKKIIGGRLKGKTDILDGSITNIRLSTGQRKRLALIVAILEDKPVYVFDEWAADQDPVFRKYFYHVILPDLRKRGKTVLAVTHDDHFFHIADRVFQMEYGTLLPYDTKAHHPVSPSR